MKTHTSMKHIRTILRIGFVSLFVLIVLATLTLTLQGTMGNPNESDMQQTGWRNDKPFELSPERGRFALTYSIVENASVFFTVPLARFVTPDLGYANGKYVSLFAPGVSFLAAPGYMIGRALGASQVGAFATIALFAFGNFLLIFALARTLWLSRVASLLGGFIFLFATPAFSYGVNLYQHHVSTFLILAGSLMVIKYRSLWSLAALWFLCAAALPVDYPNLVLMLPLVLYALPRLVEVSVANALTIKVHFLHWLTVFAAAVPLAFFFWFNTVSYGSPMQLSGTVESVSKIDEFGKPAINVLPTIENLQDVINAEKQEKSAVGFFDSRDLLNGLYVLLLSPDRGVITFTPVLLLGIFGIWGLFQTKKKEATLLSGIIIANLVLYAMWGDPWGGWAFGARYLIPSYAILALGVAAGLNRWNKSILFLLLFATLGSYSLYINTAGALTSNANPPQAEVLRLEKITQKQEKYSFDRNLDEITANDLRSFVYRTWLHTSVSSWQYFQAISGTLIGLLALGTLLLPLSKKEDQS
jgi:hypothetical protein